MTERTIPILHCPSVPEVVDFYAALGFETTFLQESPYAFAVLRYGDDLELQFLGDESVVPAESRGACYVLTDRVDEVYAAFRRGLRAVRGRVPVQGIPHLGQLVDTPYGVRQFLMTDPGGNNLRVGQPTGGDHGHPSAPREPFARALHNAWMLGVSKGEPAQGARVLDHALARQTPASTAERLRALVLRAELALHLEDPDTAARVLAEARTAEAGLSPEERESLTDDLTRAEDLRDFLRPA